jgi:DNA-binding CsgD family transcriptional regulator
MLAKTRLVGRAAQIRALRTAQEAADQGNFRCVLLSGEPGVGKSRLAAETLSQSRKGSIGLLARAYPMGETSPMGVWAEAFESHLRSLEPDEISKLCGGFLDDLSTLCRSVAILRSNPLERDPPRSRLLQGMSLLLGNLSRKAPVRIVLDDVHLADSSSWEALHYLARSLAGEPILIIATARPHEIESQPGAREVLLSLHKDGVLSTLKIPPLAREEVRELAEEVLGHLPERNLYEWLVDNSRGNPMFALSLLESLAEQHLDGSTPALATLPEAIEALVESQLLPLDSSDVGLLELISVTGQRVVFEDLLHLSSRPTEDVEAALGRLIRSRLLSENEVGGSLIYEIPHPLFREVLFQRIGGTRRRSMHRQVGQTLLAAGRLGAAAPHFARSAGVGDAEAIRALTDAVKQAEETEAYREALTILNSLVPLIPPGDARWLEVLDAFSWQPEWVVDHRADVHAKLGVGAARQIDRVLRGSSDPARQGVVKFRLASFLAWGNGELPEAERFCRDALALFEQAGDKQSQLLASTELAWIDQLEGNFAAAVSRADSVIEEARQLGENFPLMQALGSKGYATLHLGNFDEAEQIFRRGVDLARSTSNDYRLTMSLAALGLVLGYKGRIPEALKLLDEGRQVYEGFGESVILEWAALVNWMAGDFQGVIELCQKALASSAGGLSRRRAFALPFAVLSCLELGDLLEARRFLDKAMAVYGQAEWSFLGQFCQWAQAMVLKREGKTAEALEMLHSAAIQVFNFGSWTFCPPALLDLAETAWQLGEKSFAAEAARDLAEVSSRVDNELYRGFASISQAWADLARGDQASAAKAAERATLEFGTTGCQAFLGRAFDTWGRSLANINREKAVAALERAAEIFQECGSPVRKSATLQVLAGLGSMGRRAAAGARGPQSLTAREREVVELAEEGLTAREIAERLFISNRTVESHLSNAYAKLGVPSKLVLLGKRPDFQAKSAGGKNGQRF